MTSYNYKYITSYNYAWYEDMTSCNYTNYAWHEHMTAYRYLNMCDMKTWHNYAWHDFIPKFIRSVESRLSKQ